MRFLLMALVALFPLASSATEVPLFDIKADCEQTVSAINGDSSNRLYSSNKLHDNCIDMEQAAYNRLKGRWSSLPADLQNHCRNAAIVTGPGSYSLLESCVDLAVSAGNNRSEFSID